MAKQSPGSQLFELAGASAQRYAMRKFRRTGFGRALNAAQRAMKRGGIRPEHLERAVRDKKISTIIEGVQQAGGPRKYSNAKSDPLDELYAALGPFGDVLRQLFGGSTGRSSQNVEDLYDAAVEVVRAFGGEVLHPKKPQDYERGVAAAVKFLEDQGFTVTPGRRKGKPPVVQPPPTEEELIIGTEIEPETGRAIEQPPLPGETSLSEEFRTPGSSNVYSFQYDYSSSTLYVRYKAPALNPKMTKNVKGKGRMTSIRGRAGATITGKTDDPGPLYAYYDVPVRVYKRLISASSAGTAVWDNLRQRGTVWGHKFRYALVQGAVVPGEDGRISTYVSRRATPRGFKKRAVAEIGRGRRRYQTSGLPERAFPNRATPNRGTPNRGRPNRG